MANETTAEPAEWSAVRFTEARQIAALIGHDADHWPAADVGVASEFRALRNSGQRSAAVEYLGHALPRLEMLAWTARIIDDAARAAALAPAARHALDVALRWVEAPGDAHRRAAGLAAEAVRRDAPERWLALAVYYSGGSIGGADQPALTPPEHASARNAVLAIGQAAYRSGDPGGFFDRALALGEQVAERGMAALSR